MARRHPWNGGEIDELPADILSYNIKEIPRATLKDISNKLNADSISAGNWETLAEKLGFTQNSVLDNLTQQAKVQNTYPGLLMLQEWSRRSGSTAHVLLHALREIQREDAVGVLVEKLFELHTMQLLVKIQDGEGSPKFLRVPTQKSAPLHASLDNTLQKPPYWYDIVGPHYDINWNSPSGILQGAQLSLRLRVEPSENSMSLIYGTSAQLCQPPPSHPLAMNIPPDPHLPFSQDNGRSLNNLSNSPQSGARREDKVLTPLQPLSCPPQPPAMCQPAAVQPHDGILYRFEPLSSIGGPPRSQCQQQFPHFSTLMSSTFELTAPPISMTSLQESTNNMEYNPSSCTDVKTPLVPHCAQEHDETLVKESSNNARENMNIPVTVGEKASPEDMNIGAAENDEMGLAEGVQFMESSKCMVTASSFMHSMYISHNAAIQFCNNPTSPQSLGSNSSSLGSAGGSDTRSQFVMELPSPDQTSSAMPQQRTSVDEIRRLANTGEYVPIHFLENMGKTSQVPDLSEEEENMQTENSDSNRRPSNGMEIAGDSGLEQDSGSYIRLAVTASSSDYTTMTKPKPCTYTMYRPGMDNSERFANFQPRPIPHSLSLDSNPGYMDMRSGGPSSSSQQQFTTASSGGMHSCMSVDSYMNSQTDLSLQNVSADLLDHSARNMYGPNMDPLLLSRSRHPLPVRGDMFQPRDRRPLTQEQELLLDQVDDPEPEYTYIDAASVSSHADLPRRSSEGVLSSGDTKFHSTGRPRLFQHRHSEARLDPRSSVSPAELQQVPGWNANITEKTVEHEMSRYINDDGNFVVWRYIVGGKYVISVSHLRIIRHYAVYESEREGKVYYYIFPKGARFTSLAGLVRHCQEHGVAETTKTFKTPDGKQAHRSGANSGGFSHVRLKFAIPARRH